MEKEKEEKEQEQGWVSGLGRRAAQRAHHPHLATEPPLIVCFACHRAISGIFGHAEPAPAVAAPEKGAADKNEAGAKNGAMPGADVAIIKTDGEPARLEIHSLRAFDVPDSDDKASELGLERPGSDPYVIVEVLDVAGPKLMAETSVLTDQASPVWTDEVLQLTLPVGIMLPLRIRVTLKDKDWSSLDDPIASSELEISTPTGSFGRGELMLKGCAKEADAQRVIREVGSAVLDAPEPRRPMLVRQGVSALKFEEARDRPPPKPPPKPDRPRPKQKPDDTLFPVKMHPDVELCFGWGFVEGNQGGLNITFRSAPRQMNCCLSLGQLAVRCLCQV